MADDHEIEVKLELDQDGVEVFRRHPLLRDCRSVSKEQRSTYFDTRKQALRAAGFSLRVRCSEDGCVQTVKEAASGAGLFDRPEWEARLAVCEPDLAALQATPIAGMHLPHLGRKLAPVVTTRVERTVWMLTHEGSELELALDRGEVRGGDRERPLAEVEIELKRGKRVHALRLARRFAEDVPVRIGVLSKVERGFALADDTFGKLAKAERVGVTPEMSVAEAFTTIVHACLRHFRLNEDLVAGNRDPAALHQVRVAMRRLRSAWSLFRPALRGKEAGRLREELRWFTAITGDARNLDVFIGRLEQQAVAVPLAPLREAREKAYDRVVAALASRRFRDLMLDLVAWVETGGWRKDGKAKQPIGPFAERRLDCFWARVCEGGAVLRTCSEEQRHRLRIAIKKMRYATEFLAGLHQRDERKRFVRALEAMQDSLGHLNDVATARDLVEYLPASAVLPEPDPTEIRRYLGRAARQFASLVKIGPYWNA